MSVNRAVILAAANLSNFALWIAAQDFCSCSAVCFVIRSHVCHNSLVTYEGFKAIEPDLPDHEYDPFSVYILSTMDYPRVVSCLEVATDVVVAVINAALLNVSMGRQHVTLSELAATRGDLISKSHISSTKLVNPRNVVRSSESLIVHTIERVWHIHNLKYHLHFLECGRDECALYYYFETIFSQPTERYPVPQTTASVFFSVTLSLVHGSSDAPKVKWRLEGQRSAHDVRTTLLPEDWLLALLKMKQRLFRLVEDMHTF